MQVGPTERLGSVQRAAKGKGAKAKAKGKVFSFWEYPPRGRRRWRMTEFIYNRQITAGACVGHCMPPVSDAAETADRTTTHTNANEMLNEKCRKYRANEFTTQKMAELLATHTHTHVC